MKTYVMPQQPLTTAINASEVNFDHFTNDLAYNLQRGKAYLKQVR